MQKEVIKIEDIIAEGSMTAQHAMVMGYRWDAVVTGGDALAIRQHWLAQQKK